MWGGQTGFGERNFENEDGDEERLYSYRKVASNIFSFIEKQYEQLYMQKSNQLANVKEFREDDLKVVPRQLDYADERLKTIQVQLSTSQRIVDLTSRITPIQRDRLSKAIKNIAAEINIALQNRNWCWTWRSGDNLDVIFDNFQLLCIEIEKSITRIAGLRPAGCFGSNKEQAQELALLDILIIRLETSSQLLVGYFGLRPLDFQPQRMVESVKEPIRLELDTNIKQTLLSDIAATVASIIPVRQIEVAPVKSSNKSSSAVLVPQKVTLSEDEWVKGLNYFYGSGYQQSTAKSIQCLKISRDQWKQQGLCLPRSALSRRKSGGPV